MLVVAGNGPDFKSLSYEMIPFPLLWDARIVCEGWWSCLVVKVLTRTCFFSSSRKSSLAYF